MHEHEYLYEYHNKYLAQKLHNLGPRLSKLAELFTCQNTERSRSAASVFSFLN